MLEALVIITLGVLLFFSGVENKRLHEDLQHWTKFTDMQIDMSVTNACHHEAENYCKEMIQYYRCERKPEF